MFTQLIEQNLSVAILWEIVVYCFDDDRSTQLLRQALYTVRKTGNFGYNYSDIVWFPPCNKKNNSIYYIGRL